MLDRFYHESRQDTNTQNHDFRTDFEIMQRHSKQESILVGCIPTALLRGAVAE